MLYTILELGKDVVRDIARALGYEVNSDALRADETNDLVDLLKEEGRSIVKEQMRFIEEEYHLRLVEITDFRQILIDLT